MSDKTYIPEGEQAPASQIGATLEALAGTIHARREAGEGSYTFRLLTGNADSPLKKVVEEANEVALAAKDVEAAKIMLAGLAGHEVARAQAEPAYLRDGQVHVIGALLIVFGAQEAVAVGHYL